MAMMPVKTERSLPAYTSEELRVMHLHAIQTRLDTGEYFLTPDNCRGCHGYDSLHIANVDTNGADINLYDDWETSMMGLSGVDPWWKAKVSHEIITNPPHSNQLQNFCTGCHAPMGHYRYFYQGHPYYTLANLDTDSIGKAGVACMGCHSIADSTLGFVFSGSIPYDTNRLIYGPFTFPMTGPMQLYVGLFPTFGDHIGESRACSPCHTLISNTVDLNGTPTGTTFTEQATYHEWENSIYPGLSTNCQGCHMPQVDEPVKIANGIGGLSPRQPYNLHQFAGANSFMVNLIKNNKASLGVSALDQNFDSTLTAINTQLKHNSLDLHCKKDTLLNDTLSVSVELINKAGHKFPTGYPSRRAVVQLIVTKTNGDTLFASGMFDSINEIKYISTPFELHHDIISDPHRTQLYEMIMGDVNGNKTTVLERSASKLKDNRIPPAGFTTTNIVYDTCTIAGNAQTDPDFNKDSTFEGTGKDRVHYQVAMNGYTGMVNVVASVYYQTLPPSWLDEMFSNHTAEIDTFRNMFNAADKTPVLVARDSIQNILINTGLSHAEASNGIEVYPSFTQNGKVTISGVALKQAVITVYNEHGECVIKKRKGLENKTEIELPDVSGIYFIHISSSQFTITRKIFRL